MSDESKLALGLDLNPLLADLLRQTKAARKLAAQIDPGLDDLLAKAEQAIDGTFEIVNAALLSAAEVVAEDVQ